MKDVNAIAGASVYEISLTFLSLPRYLVTFKPVAVTVNIPAMIAKGRSASKGTGYMFFVSFLRLQCPICTIKLPYSINLCVKRDGGGC